MNLCFTFRNVGLPDSRWTQIVLNLIMWQTKKFHCLHSNILGFYHLYQTWCPPQPLSCSSSTSSILNLYSFLTCNSLLWCLWINMNLRYLDDTWRLYEHRFHFFLFPVPFKGCLCRVCEWKELSGLIHISREWAKYYLPLTLTKWPDLPLKITRAVQCNQASCPSWQDGWKFLALNEQTHRTSCVWARINALGKEFPFRGFGLLVSI